MSTKQDASFAVQISFVGLCMSSTTFNKKRKHWTLHVAMPTTDTHETAIIYDGRYAPGCSPFESRCLDGYPLNFSKHLPADPNFRPELPSKIIRRCSDSGPQCSKAIQLRHIEE